jgi:hypothetical protein
LAHSKQLKIINCPSCCKCKLGLNQLFPFLAFIPAKEKKALQRNEKNSDLDLIVYFPLGVGHTLALKKSS